jgi:hypothetical protein
MEITLPLGLGGGGTSEILARLKQQTAIKGNGRKKFGVTTNNSDRSEVKPPD